MEVITEGRASQDVHDKVEDFRIVLLAKFHSFLHRHDDVGRLVVRPVF